MARGPCAWTVGRLKVSRARAVRRMGVFNGRVYGVPERGWSWV